MINIRSLTVCLQFTYYTLYGDGIPYIHDETFERESFCGSPINSKSFPANYGLVYQQNKFYKHATMKVFL